jgi:O-antigen ligase
MLYEVRMSPQLHTKLYGFFPHDWRQQIRAGGFRPVVFLGHGLLVAIFGCITAIAAFVLWRDKHQVTKGKGGIIFAYFCLVLVLCKTYSAVIYLLFIVSLVFFLSEKMRVRVMSLIAIAVLIFPAIRHQLPLSDITAFFMDLNPERAASLQYRFDNEDILLDKANEKPWFGWGSWGRNRVYNPVSGEDISITDGAWIIRFGAFGWLGYLATMGLVAYPVIVWAKHIKKGSAGKALSPYSLALCAIAVIYLIDQIPNASINHLTYLIGGALLGNAKLLSSTRGEIQDDTADKAPSQVSA